MPDDDELQSNHDVLVDAKEEKNDNEFDVIPQRRPSTKPRAVTSTESSALARPATLGHQRATTPAIASHSITLQPILKAQSTQHIPTIDKLRQDRDKLNAWWRKTEQDLRNRCAQPCVPAQRPGQLSHRAKSDEHTNAPRRCRKEGSNSVSFDEASFVRATSPDRHENPISDGDAGHSGSDSERQRSGLANCQRPSLGSGRSQTWTK